MSQLTCIVVTPEATAVETKADFVVLPLYDGEIGLAAGRAPLIGRLGFGEMRVTVGGKVTRYYLDGGFVQVSGDIVSVLTNRAVPAEEVDVALARQQSLDALELPIPTPEQEAIRDRLLIQARGQLQVARRASSARV
jgi:F-type H+-transporting ATPase subunit epsilon